MRKIDYYYNPVKLTIRLYGVFDPYYTCKIHQLPRLLKHNITTLNKLPT